MAQILKEIEDAGRSTDSIVGHLTLGEIVIPSEIAEIPEVREAIAEIFDAYDVNIDEFTVGHEANKINPETGYPEFFFNKVFKAVSKAVSGGAKAVGKVVQGATKTASKVGKAVGKTAQQAGKAVGKAASQVGKNVTKAVTSITGGNQKAAPAQPAAPSGPDPKLAQLEKTYKQNEKAFDDALAAMEKKAADEKAARDAEAKQRAISAESSKAQSIADQNRAEISEKLSKTLSTPYQQNASLARNPYTVSGFGPNKRNKMNAGTGGAAPQETAATMPVAILAQKINQDSGGTNEQQNKFNIPQIRGITLGGM